MLSQIKGTYTVYSVLKELGKGTYGQVFQVQDFQTSKYYACKIISKYLMIQYNAEDMIRQEIKIQSMMSHRNVLKIIETFEDAKSIFIILEYCAKGTLKIPDSPYSEEQLFNVVYQLMAGLDYIHSHFVIHRDIKLDNILIHEDGTIKISDFGWATSCQKADRMLCGTTEYMPPEVVSNKAQTVKLDVWSLGVIVYILLYCYNPFKAKKEEEVIKKILETDCFENKEDGDLQVMLKSMLNKEQNERPYIKELYLSKWMIRMMKENNIFNKYENDQRKKQILSKSVQLKTIDSCAFTSQFTNSLKSTASTNPCSPAFTFEQTFSFQDCEQFVSVPLPNKQ